MKTARETRPIQAFVPAILWAVLHSMLWIVLLGMMLKFVPTFEKIFQDFDAYLPVMTVWTIRSSCFAASYWFLILPVIAVLCVADLIVLCALYLRPKGVVARRLWLVLMLLVPLGFMAWTMLAMYIGLASLTQQLR